MKDTTNIAALTISEKLQWLEARYWRFGQDEALFDNLQSLFNVDDEGQMTAKPRVDPLTDETKGLMVLGGSGSGKTALLKRMLRASPLLTEFKNDHTGNTLFVTVPPEASIKKLAEIVLSKTGYDKSCDKLRAADAWEIARHRFTLVGIKMVIVDECHHIVQPGPGKDVRTAIQSLKHLMQSDKGVALVISGVPALRDAVLSEPSGETFRRFSVYELAKIRPETNSARLFKSNFSKCGEKLGLSTQLEDAFADRILFAEHGMVGRTIALGKEILRDAVIRKDDTLSLEHAERVFVRLNRGCEVTPFDPAAWGVVKRELEAIGWAQ